MAEGNTTPSQCKQETDLLVSACKSAGIIGLKPSETAANVSGLKAVEEASLATSSAAVSPLHHEKKDEYSF
ncbi:Bifunctional inhibitor/lipid-transfer protein/seed storage 2S albumin superfamily protein [Prunus dulcis]|uniref:Bifunctional inhibitor/lipid-transfer protein/seed storage 2S albumin superfamily protein n=1 Tax=Prunus dulcis TaxID=3755 RepID=A0A4Y1R234_PRUDU|nr:Bifunctional inhibitor/lipid-transfer protein/seed storage 2S albumin superfamily protein [Prunus dulcis]